MRSRARVLVVVSALVAESVAVGAVGRALVPGNAAGAESFKDGYACYPGQFSGFQPQPPLLLRDLLAGRPRSVPLAPPTTVCAPATSGILPSPSKGYLVCYPTTAAKLGVPRRLAGAEFGGLTLTPTARRDVVCVESDRVDQRNAPRRSTQRLFVCYSTRTSGGGTQTVRIRDAFGIIEANSAAPPYRGCGAAGVKIVPTVSPKYLTCATVNAKSPAGALVLKNRFGFLRAVLGPRATVCVEAS
jgi:hypothetical protein